MLVGPKSILRSGVLWRFRLRKGLLGSIVIVLGVRSVVLAEAYWSSSELSTIHEIRCTTGNVQRFEIFCPFLHCHLSWFIIVPSSPWAFWSWHGLRKEPIMIIIHRSLHASLPHRRTPSTCRWCRGWFHMLGQCALLVDLFDLDFVFTLFSTPLFIDCLETLLLLLRWLLIQGERCVANLVLRLKYFQSATALLTDEFFDVAWSASTTSIPLVRWVHRLTNINEWMLACLSRPAYAWHSREDHRLHWFHIRRTVNPRLRWSRRGSLFPYIHCCACWLLDDFWCAIGTKGAGRLIKYSLIPSIWLLSIPRVLLLRHCPGVIKDLLLININLVSLLAQGR